jgi:hypothetical protein
LLAVPFVAPGIAADVSRGFWGDDASAGGLSVAYLAGSDQLADPGDYVREWDASFAGWSEVREREAYEAPLVDLIAGSSPCRGDSSFQGRGVRFGMHGIHLPETTDAETRLRSCALHVIFPGARSHKDPEGRSFLAWHLRTDGVPSCSPSSRCFIPLDDRGEIRLRVDWTRAAFAGRVGDQHAELRLATRRQSGLPGLRRGIYFVGLPAGRPLAGDELAGHQLSAVDSPSGRMHLNRTTWWSRRRAVPTNPYLVFSVEYGDHTNRAAAAGQGETHV